MLRVAETPFGLLVRQDRGGDETWQLALLEAGGGLRAVTHDPKAIHRDRVLSPDRRRVRLSFNPGGRADWVLGVLDLETGEIERWLLRRVHDARRAVEEPDLWDAAVDIVGIADWHSFFANTSGWRRADRGRVR